ncbi:MAG: hypothetical protein R3Y53_03965 [Bacillota bacterium]
MATFGNTTENAPAPVKAKIVIRKGGVFAPPPEEGDSVSDLTGSMNDLLSDVFGADEANEVTAQASSVMSMIGSDDGVLEGYKDGEVIEVQMNPTSYSISSNSNFNAEAMGGAPPEGGKYGTFGAPKPKTLSVKLIYDIIIQKDYFDQLKQQGNAVKDIGMSAINLFTGDISMTDAMSSAGESFKAFDKEKDLQQKYLEKLLALTRILSKINTPPLIAFEYGSVVFEGYAKSVSVDYKKFSTAGEVLSAEVSLSMEEGNQFAESSKDTTEPQGLPSMDSISDAIPDDEI